MAGRAGRRGRLRRRRRRPRHPAASTASWLRNRLHLSPGAAHTHLRTARALFGGPLTATAQALTTGELSVAHAATLAAGTHDLPHHTTAEAEPALLAAARRLDPPRLRRVIGHLRYVADPEGADRQAERRHAQRGLWLAATLEGMVALQGLLEAEAGQTLLAALAPLARPHSAADDRSGQRVRPTTYGTGWTAAPPTWPTWPCCAGPTTERSMRAAGS